MSFRKRGVTNSKPSHCAESHSADDVGNPVLFRREGRIANNENPKRESARKRSPTRRRESAPHDPISLERSKRGERTVERGERVANTIESRKDRVDPTRRNRERTRTGHRNQSEHTDSAEQYEDKSKRKPVKFCARVGENRTDRDQEVERLVGPDPVRVEWDCTVDRRGIEHTQTRCGRPLHREIRDTKEDR